MINQELSSLFFIDVANSRSKKSTNNAARLWRIMNLICATLFLNARAHFISDNKRLPIISLANVVIFGSEVKSMTERTFLVRKKVSQPYKKVITLRVS